MLKKALCLAACLALLPSCAPGQTAVPAHDRDGLPARQSAAPTITRLESPVPHSPEPTPSPTPTPTGLVSRNHNEAAEAYSVPARQVQQWLAKQPTDGSKQIFLTFDDGPNHAMTPRILDVLREQGVPATFFVLGKAVADAPDVLKRQIEEGHAIGLHSFTHQYGYLYLERRGNAVNILVEFDQSVAAVRAVLGEGFAPGPWRYPGGHMSWRDLAPADAGLADQGVHWVDWNALNGDAEPKRRRPGTPSKMVAMATEPIRAGVSTVVLLAHDAEGKDLTLQTLPQVIEAYRGAGYEFHVIG